MKTRSASVSSRSRSGRAAGARRPTTLRATGSRTRTSGRSTRPVTVQVNRTAKVTTNHEEIRRWAEARGGVPAVVKTTHRKDEPEGILRIDFPDIGDENLEHVSWDEWFKIFDKHQLAFLYQERKANGEPSTFNKLVRCSELL